VSEKRLDDPLIGYMILEDYAEDMSDWSGQITGPQDPTGANLAWESPIKMIECSAYDALKAENEHLREAMEYALDQLEMFNFAKDENRVSRADTKLREALKGRGA